jgi:hypothetical protein
VIEHEDFCIYIPITTSISVNAVLTLAIWLLRK